MDGAGQARVEGPNDPHQFHGIVLVGDFNPGKSCFDWAGNAVGVFRGCVPGGRHDKLVTGYLPVGYGKPVSDGAARAARVARTTMAIVRERIGLLVP